MKSYRLAALLFVCVGGVSIGCSHFQPAPRKPRPSVSIVNLVVNDMTVFETGVRLTVRLDNDSPEPLLVNGATHSVVINDLYVGKALDSGRFEVPRLGSVTRDLRISLSNMSRLAKLKAYIDSGQIIYRIESLLYSTSSEGDVRLAKQERIDLTQPVGLPGGPRPTGRKFDPDEFRLAAPESIPQGDVP